VRSDERDLKPASVLRLGETLRLWVPGIAPEESAPALPDIVYEDDWLIAVDKPPGMLVHPVGQAYAWALIGLVREGRPGLRIDLSHRLDRETSGIVLLTKHEDANRRMKEAFARRRVVKEYAALVRGVPAWDELEVDASLGHAKGSVVNLRRGHDPDGESAVTHFVVEARMAAHALVACLPLTGRTHQIRAHLEHAGFPILGDKLYGQPDSTFLGLFENGLTDDTRRAVGFPRHALHARSLHFPHPHTGQMVRIRAPLPADMQAIVEGAVPAWALVGDAPAPTAESGPSGLDGTERPAENAED
jgi:23S rRNA pseudouridine1911/1915/1917 synthase